MTALTLQGISKAFTIRYNRADSLKSKFIGIFNTRYREKKRTLWALKGLDLEVYRGETLGLIGANGSGKSTLLRIIAGIFPPTEGRLSVNGTVVPMIELGVGFHPELTGKENIYLNASLYGLSKKEVDKIYSKIVDFSELKDFIDTPIKNYSSGMYMRLGFSIAVHIEPDILLIDEIFAVGDEHFQRRCIKKMEAFKEAKKTIIFVSHNAAAIQSMCDRVCLLNQGKIHFIGPPKEAIARYLELIDGG